MNENQINYMKHCIGYERKLVKRGKYEPYRNYFNNGDDRDSDWDDLVEKGYAVSRVKFDQIIYFVTEAGMKFLSSILDVKIVRESK